MRTVTAYQCSYCNMTSVYASSVKRHEKKSCQKAPGSCGTCKLFSEDWETVYNPHHGGNPGSTDYEVKIPWCGHTDTELGLKQTGCRFWIGVEEALRKAA